MFLFHKSAVSNKQLAIVERFNEIIFHPVPRTSNICHITPDSNNKNCDFFLGKRPDLSYCSTLTHDYAIRYSRFITRRELGSQASRHLLEPASSRPRGRILSAIMCVSLNKLTKGDDAVE